MSIIEGVGKISICSAFALMLLKYEAYMETVMSSYEP